MKTDALDHAFGHDLVGCQDIAWDLAGAAVEFDLDTEERETLARRSRGNVRAQGCPAAHPVAGGLLPRLGAWPDPFRRCHHGRSWRPKAVAAADRMYALKLQSWVRSEARSRITDNI